MDKKTLDRARNLEFLMEELQAAIDKFTNKNCNVRGITLSGNLCMTFRDEFLTLYKDSLKKIEEEFANL